MTQGTKVGDGVLFIGGTGGTGVAVGKGVGVLVRFGLLVFVGAGVFVETPVGDIVGGTSVAVGS